MFTKGNITRYTQKGKQMTCVRRAAKKHLRLIAEGEHQKRRGGAQGKSLF